MRVTALIIILLVAIPCMVVAQDTKPPQQEIKTPAEDTRPPAEELAPSDTIFLELILDEEGIIAYDTTGRQWYYDFADGFFVIGGFDTPENISDEGSLDDGDYFAVEERCTERKYVKPWSKTVLVGVDEYVEGNIIAYGRITIKGWVKGNVTSINNRVLVSSSGQVDGDIIAREIIIKEGGNVLGSEIIDENPLELIDFSETFNVSGVIVIVILMTIFYVIGLLMQLLMPKHSVHFSECMKSHRIKTTMLGFFLLFISPLIIGLVIITIVGIVISPFIPILYVLAIIMGVASFGRSVGTWITKRLFGREQSGLFETFLGLTVFWMFWLMMAVLMGSSNSVAFGFGIVFLVLAILISIYPVFAGIGAAFLTRFGVRSYTSWKERFDDPQAFQPPAPPPIPDPPGGTSIS